MNRSPIEGIPTDLRFLRNIVLTSDGIERVTNGTFTGSATGWTLASGWAYSANTVVKNAAGTGALEQNIGAQSYQLYLITATISNWTAGTTLTPSIGGVDGTAITGNISYSEYIATTAVGNLKFTPTTDVRCTIDGVSAKLIGSSIMVDSTGAIKGWINSDGTISFVGLALSGLTASELIAADATKGLQSLAVASYPSLAEIAYVKGATSAIQTQLDRKKLALRIGKSILKCVDDDDFKVSFPFTPPGETSWTDVTLKLALAAGGGQLKAGDAVTAHEFYSIWLANSVTVQPVASDFVIREGRTTVESGHTFCGTVYNTTVTNATIRAFDMAEHNVYMWRDGSDLQVVNGGTATTFTDVDLDPTVGTTRYVPATARQAIMWAYIFVEVTADQYGELFVRKDGTAGTGRRVLLQSLKNSGEGSRTSSDFMIELVNGIFEYKVAGDAATTLQTDIYVSGFVDSDGVSVSD